MKKFLFSFVVFLFIFLSDTGFTQQDFSEVEIKVVPVSGNIYLLTGRGGNIGVSAGPDGILMIDDQFKPLSGKIQTALDNLNKGKLKFVLNTHWHGDHTGGNAVFGIKVPIIAHTNVRRRLSTRQEIKFFNSVREPLSKEGLPVITFDESLSVHFNGEEIKVLHYPTGHTDGDSVIFFTGSKVVHMGDLFFSGLYPFIDLDSGGNVQGYLQNVMSILAQLPEDVILIPGHGPLSRKKDLETFAEMLNDSLTVVRNGMANGKDLSEIKQAGLPEKWDAWKNGLLSTDQWIQIVYNSLTQPDTSSVHDQTP